MSKIIMIIYTSFILLSASFSAMVAVGEYTEINLPWFTFFYANKTEKIPAFK